jgi:hypothetical protein
VKSTNNSTPGIDYNVSCGEKMVASAPGELFFIEMLNTSRAGGYWVALQHPKLGGIAQFITFYAHLDSVSEN